jgi:hypothetical protein
MKKLLSTVVLLLLCACSEEYTGQGSVDLHITSITFRDSDPATITGMLPPGKPAEFILSVDASNIAGMSLQYSPGVDTSGMVEVNNSVCFPLAATQGAVHNGASAVKMQHTGLFWTPNYSIRADGTSRRIYAAALLTNTTTQIWQTDTVRLMDPDENTVATATGHITVRPGTYPIPWWNAPAGVPEAVITYGWPVRGRWNPVIAVYCPSAGRVESWAETVYQRNDTLWFPADSLIALGLTWQQYPGSYSCFMEATSTTDINMHWKILWPETMPRGADIEPGINSFELAPGESVTILYKEIY